jgi:hypothetical protein
VARRRRRPRAAAAEAEADGEDRAAAELAEIADAGCDVGLHLLVRQLLHERHVVPVVGPLVDAGGAAEVVERDRGVAALREAQRELLVEAVEDRGRPAGSRRGRDLSLRDGPEGREAVAVLALEDEVVVGDAAPEIRGIGGSESTSKHMASRAYERRRVLCGVP